MTVAEQTTADQGVIRFSSPLRRARGHAKILLIEDHPDLREEVAEHLTQHGFRVLTAADGPTGLSQFMREQPDLVVLDLQLTGMDGLRVLGEIRDRSPELPIVVLTTTLAPVYSAVHSVTVLRKPFDPAWLLRDVRNALDRPHRRRRS